MSSSPGIWRVRTGLLAIALAPLLAISPFIAGAFLSVIFCAPDANEGNCKWAALPWFMFFSSAGVCCRVSRFDRCAIEKKTLIL